MDQQPSKTVSRSEGSSSLAILLFFLVAPAIVSCVETFLQHSMVVDGDLGVSLGIALLFTIPGTFFAWLTTWLIARLPAAEHLPLPVLLLIGFAASLLIFRPYNRLIYDLVPVAAPHIAVVASSTWQQISRFLLVNVPGAVIWTALNLLFIAKLSFPVYGSRRDLAPEPLAQSRALTLPNFCSAARIERLSDLWAVSAEEHYLRLRGSFGTRMIRHSFGAALEQLPQGSGLQVHRSHWVAFGRVARIENGKTPQLVLADGTLIPVSSRYLQAVLLTEAQLVTS